MMNLYLVETKHTKENCRHIMNNFWAYGHVTHFVWGCEQGVCTGWAIIEAESDEEALLSVPSLVRNTTAIIRVNRFSPLGIQNFHEEAINAGTKKT